MIGQTILSVEGSLEGGALTLWALKKCQAASEIVVVVFCWPEIWTFPAIRIATPRLSPSLFKPITCWAFGFSRDRSSSRSAWLLVAGSRLIGTRDLVIVGRSRRRLILERSLFLDFWFDLF